MFVSVTRLRLRSWLFLPAFFFHANRSSAQAAKSVGFQGGQTLLDRNLVFWTVTAWQDEAAMKAYRGAAAHRAAMPKLAKWCSEAQTAHYTTQSSNLPAWTQAHTQLMAAGRVSKVNHPSGTQSMQQIPAPATDAWRIRVLQ